MEPLPHPLTGQPFASPVPPGTGWPEDPAASDTPVAKTPASVRRLARGASSERELQARASVCRACPRLVEWREEVAATGRRAYAGQPYWGRPVPSLGPVDDDAWLLVLGLAPAAHGGNRTGRVFTGDRSGDWIFAALHRAGLATQATSGHAGDGQGLIGTRIIAPVKCAPPANKPTPAERDACAPWADRELELTGASLKAIVALGAFAWDAALALATRQRWAVARPRPRFGHGAEATFERPGAGAVHLVGCYHVSQQNTFTRRLTEPMLDAVLAQAAKYR
ncbi:uracil-DNA glycosylase [Spongisporangium articulatum]|uniref:Type-5 uracil-DNA glycosylase n=1 Tax=Spongisporangium articulatum TaxID=3362603 RepID=A0ABW8ARD8_9ACTN